MNRVRIVSCLLALLFPALASGWPIDGYPDTGIRRLEEQRLIAIGELPGSGQPPGGRWPTSAVDIRLLDRPDFKIPAVDETLSGEILEMLGEKADRYGIAVLDMTNPDSPVFASWQSTLASQ